MKVRRLTRLFAAAAVSTVGLATIGFAAGTVTNAYAAGSEAATSVGGSGVAGTIAPAADESTTATYPDANNLVTGPASATGGSYNVTINVTGLTANQNWNIVYCEGHVDTGNEATQANQCTASGSITGLSTGPDGVLLDPATGNPPDVTINTLTTGQHGATFSCDSSDPCALMVANGVSPANPYAMFDFDFNAPPPTLNPVHNIGDPTPPAATQTGAQGPINILGAHNNTGNISVVYGTAKDTNGVAETITGNSTVVTPPAHGSVTSSSVGTFTYQYTGATITSPLTDSFVVAGPTVTCGAAEIGGCTGTVAASDNITVSVSLTVPPSGQTCILVAEINPTTIQCSNTGGFYGPQNPTHPVGDTIVVGSGSADSETATIASVDPNQITLTAPLANAHSAGEVVADSSTALTSTTCASPTGCVSPNSGSLTQIITIPLAAGTITMSEPSSSEVSPGDALITLTNQVIGSGPTESCNPVTGGKHQITGQPFFACGALAPLTIINPGTDDAWSVTGSVSDFLDTNAPGGSTCDTAATYHVYCIPAANLQWGPVAAIGADLVPGDVETVTAGPATADIPYTQRSLVAAGDTLADTQIVGSEAVGTISAPASTSGADPALLTTGFGPFDANPVTLCSAAAGTGNGTFVCGADLEVAVPASAEGTGSPYTATMTLTLA